VTRLTAMAGGVIGVGVALVAAGVVSALSIFYTIMGVSLFVPVLAGLYNDHATSVDALAAIIAGIGIVGGWEIFYHGPTIASFTPAMAGLAGAIVAFVVVHVIRRLFGSNDSTDRAIPSFMEK
jgi:solute:Na+ symporter, SSS family